MASHHKTNFWHSHRFNNYKMSSAADAWFLFISRRVNFFRPPRIVSEKFVDNFVGREFWLRFDAVEKTLKSHLTHGNKVWIEIVLGEFVPNVAGPLCRHWRDNTGRVERFEILTKLIKLVVPTPYSVRRFCLMLFNTLLIRCWTFDS